MGKRTSSPIRQRRALNQVLLYTRNAPGQALRHPAVFVRALRSVLRMSQAQLARRSGVSQPHIARWERGKIDAQLGTLRRLFGALFCDLLVLPRARKRPADALAERELEKGDGRATWRDPK